MSDLHKKIKVIPIQAPFLRVLAFYTCRQFDHVLPDLSRLMMIFPSQRNKYYFRRYLLEASGLKGIIPPVMRTVDELLDDLYEAGGGRPGICLNRIERNFILKQVIDDLKVKFWQDLSFLQFVAVGDRLLGFFDEVTKEQVTMEAIEQEAQVGHYPERYVSEELPILRAIYDTYRERIRATSYQDVLSKYEMLAERQELSFLDSYTYIGVAGLVATTKIETMIIGRMLKEYPVELVLHSSLKELVDAVNPSTTYYLHHKLLDELKVVDINAVQEIRPDPAAVTKPVIHIRKNGTDYAQIFHIGRILERLKDYEPHRCAIILTDENLVEPVAEMLASAGYEFNVSMGFPFTQSILYSLLVLLKGTVEKGFHYTEFFSFINHPLVKNAVIDGVPLREKIYRFQEYMVKHRLNYFNPDQSYDGEYDVLCAFVKRCADAVSHVAPLDEYVHAIIGLINTVLSYNQEVVIKGMPGIMEFPERLHRLARLRFYDGTYGGMELLGLVLRALENETYAMRGEPMKGIQVIGLLEARNLDFDCIILPSMNETVFPRYSERDLFVNRQIRKTVGLPYDKERENHYYYYFTQLLEGKKEVYISYVEEAKRDMRSRFVDMLCARGEKIDDTKLLLASRSTDVPERSVEKDKNIMRRIEKLATVKGLSPTSLKDYRECPYRFYVKYLLKIREPDEIVEEAGPKEWGSALHESLCNLYRKHFPQRFTREQLPLVRKRLFSEFESALRNSVAARPRSITLLDMNVYKKQLEGFLENELERFDKGFTVETERLEERLRAHLEIGGRSVLLMGYTDRVDRIDNGIYVIDYKTTAPKPEKYRIGDAFVEFQLPLYALLLCDGDYSKITSMAYYEIKKNTRIIEIVERDAVASYLSGFRESILEPTVSALYDPAIPFARREGKDACKYCSYQDLCGVRSAE